MLFFLLFALFFAWAGGQVPDNAVCAQAIDFGGPYATISNLMIPAGTPNAPAGMDFFGFPMSGQRPSLFFKFMGNGGVCTLFSAFNDNPVGLYLGMFSGSCPLNGAVAADLGFSLGVATVTYQPLVSDTIIVKVANSAAAPIDHPQRFNLVLSCERTSCTETDLLAAPQVGIKQFRYLIDDYFFGFPSIPEDTQNRMMRWFDVETGDLYTDLLIRITRSQPGSPPFIKHGYAIYETCDLTTSVPILTDLTSSGGSLLLRLQSPQFTAHRTYKLVVFTFSAGVVTAPTVNIELFEATGGSGASVYGLMNVPNLQTYEGCNAKWYMPYQSLPVPDVYPTQTLNVEIPVLVSGNAPVGYSTRVCAQISRYKNDDVGASGEQWGLQVGPYTFTKDVVPFGVSTLKYCQKLPLTLRFLANYDNNGDPQTT